MLNQLQKEFLKKDIYNLKEARYSFEHKFWEMPKDTDLHEAKMILAESLGRLNAHINAAIWDMERILRSKK